MSLQLRRKIPQKHPRRRWLTMYLGKTPVRWLTILLEHGCPYWQARLSNLGRVKTIFNRGKRAKRRGKKLVAEAARIMIREKNHREKLLKYKAMLNGMLPVDYGKELEMVVTVVHTNHGIIICDGNHRAIASYLVGRRSLDVEYLDIRWPA